MSVVLVWGFNPKKLLRTRETSGSTWSGNPAHTLAVSVIAAIVTLVAGDAIRTSTSTTRSSPRSCRRPADDPGGPVASQGGDQELGTNRGGFYNAIRLTRSRIRRGGRSGSNPFMPVISFSMPRTFVRMVGDKRRGYAIAAR